MELPGRWIVPLFFRPRKAEYKKGGVSVRPTSNSQSFMVESFFMDVLIKFHYLIKIVIYSIIICTSTYI